MKRKPMRSAIGIVFCCAALCACTTLKQSEEARPAVISSENEARLHGRDWELQTIMVEGRRVVMHVDARMTLRFLPEGRVGGYGSVNQFNGAYSFSPDGRLSWLGPNFAVTRKGGPPELMEKEAAYFKGLRLTQRAFVAGDLLELRSDDGSTILTFKELKAG
jgi:heat shock protein HslJ